MPVPTKEELQAALEARHGKERQDKWSAATVAICGLGGLGSNIALSLARAGVGHLILIDFDRVDITNLHRQQYMLAQLGQYKTEALADTLRTISPYIRLTTITERVTEENYREFLAPADVICEAFDSAEAKAMLVNCVLETMPGRYLVSASGMAGLGQANTIQTRRLTRHFYLCGDGVSDVNDGMCLVSSRVTLCAAHQAHAVLRILAEEYDV
ncbi:MAG: thiamine biosynthesis protein ThiF [Ruminiclostridium sp.]|nr:thiamine biosynthesis protein ThiF [Ruminiclostridium sp.]